MIHGMDHPLCWACEGSGEIMQNLTEDGSFDWGMCLTCSGSGFEQLREAPKKSVNAVALALKTLWRTENGHVEK